MSLLADLIAVRDLLAPEGAWAQGASARDRNGKSVDLLDRGAVCWCLYGATGRVCCGRRGWTNKSRERRYAIEPVIFRLIKGYSMAAWNDAPKRKHSQVIAMLDRAIEAAK